MKTIVITGCAGLLGANFSRYLLNKGLRVLGIDDLSGGCEDFLPVDKNFKFLKLILSPKIFRMSLTNKSLT